MVDRSLNVVLSLRVAMNHDVTERRVVRIKRPYRHSVPGSVDFLNCAVVAGPVLQMSSTHYMNGDPQLSEATPLRRFCKPSVRQLAPLRNWWIRAPPQKYLFRHPYTDTQSLRQYLDEALRLYFPAVYAHHTVYPISPCTRVTSIMLS
jgi:hypothetical protein